MFYLCLLMKIVGYSNYKLPFSDIPYTIISGKFPNDTEPYFIVGSRIAVPSSRNNNYIRLYFIIYLFIV